MKLSVSTPVNSMDTNILPVLRFVTHSRTVLKIARRFGWLPGARYTNLRDVRHLTRVWFLDIDWKNYSFIKHLEAAKAARPYLTVAQDIMDVRDLTKVLDQAHELLQWATHVIVVPKAPELGPGLTENIPRQFILGYSVPTKYGGTPIPVTFFKRPVHLLGGRPDVQRKLADVLPVASIDCNRFTLDASFGDYFDGERFRPHPIGGYMRCLEDSIRAMNALWRSYRVPLRSDLWVRQQKET